MVLKQLRIAKRFTQEQLAEMSGLNVRTIQRVESGHKASVETLKCLAAVLEVDIQTLTQETLMLDKQSDHWQQLPFWIKAWFAFNFLSLRPSRQAAIRVLFVCHGLGFVLCIGGLISEVALVSGLWMLATAHLTWLLLRQGDHYGVWYDAPEQ